MMHIKLELRKWLRLRDRDREIEMVVYDRQCKVYDWVEIDSAKGGRCTWYSPTFVVTSNSKRESYSRERKNGGGVKHRLR